MAEWAKIDENAPLYDGDRVRLHFQATGFSYVTAAQIALIEDAIAKDKRFHMINHSLPKEKKEGPIKVTEFTVECEVDTPGVSGEWFMTSAVGTAAVITAKVMAGVIIAAIGTAMVWLALSSAEKLVKAVGESAEQSEKTITAIGQVLMAAIVGYVVLKVLDK